MIKDTALLSLYSNSNIGLYLFATNNVTFCGIRLRTEQKETVERILKTKVVTLTVAGIPYPGLFLIELEEEILAPSIIFEHEKKSIEKHTGKKVATIETSETALRNIIALHKGKAIIAKAAEKTIKDSLKGKGISYMEVEHDEFDTIGSLIVTGKERGMIAPVFDSRIAEKIGKFLGLEMIETTINNHGVFLSSGVCHNNSGILIGEESLTEEVMDITAALSEEE
jgi:translation initiation factor 6